MNEIAVTDIDREIIALKALSGMLTEAVKSLGNAVIIEMPMLANNYCISWPFSEPEVTLTGMRYLIDIDNTNNLIDAGHRGVKATMELRPDAASVRIHVIMNVQLNSLIVKEVINADHQKHINVWGSHTNTNIGVKGLPLSGDEKAFIVSLDAQIEKLEKGHDAWNEDEDHEHGP